jgi:glycosyltransferase involved in cell wall biosynthesis
MRVLYVNQTAAVSGAERSLLALLQGLGDAVEPVVACPDGELADALGEMGIEHERLAGTRASFRLHPLHTSRGLADIGRSAIAVRRLAGRLDPALIHANTTRAALLGMLRRSGAAPPLLAHIRDWVPDGRLPRLVLATVGRRADAIVANSAYIARQFDGLSLRRPVQVVHNPVDLERFDPDRVEGRSVRAELGLSAEARVLTVVAQLTPWKGQDDAIRALAELGAAAADVTLLLVGSAKFSGAATQYDNVAYEWQLHDLAEGLGVAERVRFLGERSDVPRILAATDLLLLPSWREAFGRIAIEAMAMAVPVAATDEGGPAEIVSPGVDGLLLPSRQPDLWARELAPLLAQSERLRQMGASGRLRARDFSLDAHAAAMLDVYRGLSD